jgi:hypothetical protein
MKCTQLIIVLILFAACPAYAQANKKTVWQGTIHLGDSPEAYPKVTSAGMAFQVPFKMEAGKATKLTVTVKDIETQAGNGHYVEVIAHFEKQPSKAPARDVVVGTFRIKDKSAEEKAFAFEFDSGKNLGDMKPDYYSVRIKVDTHVSFTFWDDILVKRIEIEQDGK